MFKKILLVLAIGFGCINGMGLTPAEVNGLKKSFATLDKFFGATPPQGYLYVRHLVGYLLNDRTLDPIANPIYAIAAPPSYSSDYRTYEDWQILWTLETIFYSLVPNNWNITTTTQSSYANLTVNGLSKCRNNTLNLGLTACNSACSCAPVALGMDKAFGCIYSWVGNQLANAILPIPLSSYNKPYSYYSNLWSNVQAKVGDIWDISDIVGTGYSSSAKPQAPIIKNILQQVLLSQTFADMLASLAQNQVVLSGTPCTKVKNGGDINICPAGYTCNAQSIRVCNVGASCNSAASYTPVLCKAGVKYCKGGLVACEPGANCIGTRATPLNQYIQNGITEQYNYAYLNYPIDENTCMTNVNFGTSWWVKATNGLQCYWAPIVPGNNTQGTCACPWNLTQPNPNYNECLFSSFSDGGTTCPKIIPAPPVPNNHWVATFGEVPYENAVDPLYGALQA